MIVAQQFQLDVSPPLVFVLAGDQKGQKDNGQIPILSWQIRQRILINQKRSLS